MKPRGEKGLGDILSDPSGPRRLLETELPKEVVSQAGEQMLRDLAALHGEDADAVIESLHRNDPLARLVVKMLDIEPKLPDRGGRRADVDRHWREYETVRALRAQGLKGKRLWEAVKERLGTNVDVDSLKQSLKRTGKRYPIAITYSKWIEEDVKGDKT